MLFTQVFRVFLIYTLDFSILMPNPCAEALNQYNSFSQRYNTSVRWRQQIHYMHIILLSAMLSRVPRYLINDIVANAILCML